jgi:hypothetical protein
MNRLGVISGLVLLLVVAAMASPDASSRTGWVTDAKCAGKTPANAECVKKCVKAGEALVFVDDANKSVLTVANPKALSGHEGQHVKVQGTVANEKITVSSVEPLPEKDMK